MPPKKPSRNLGLFTKNDLLEPPMVLKAVILATVVPAVAGSTPMVSKIRRSDCDSLTKGNYYSERYAAITHGQYIIEQDLPYGCPPTIYKRSQKALEARNTFTFDHDGEMFETSGVTGATMGPGLPASRRSGIAYFFEHIYGCPDKSDW